MDQDLRYPRSLPRYNGTCLAILCIHSTDRRSYLALDVDQDKPISSCNHILILHNRAQPCGNYPQVTSRSGFGTCPQSNTRGWAFPPRPQWTSLGSSAHKWSCYNMLGCGPSLIKSKPKSECFSQTPMI